MDIKLYTEPVEQFRKSLYQNFNKQADTLMELVDAISSKPDAKSIAEYSLASCFRRSYSMLYKAIDGMSLEPMWLAKELSPYLPKPERWPFWLLMVDVTPNPRPYAQTLEDRGMVYQPEVVKGKLPVTIGHQYSTVALGLEPEAGVSPSWVLPLLSERVATDQDKEMVGMEQIGMLLENAELPFSEELTVEVADSSYSKPACLHAHRKYPNLVTIVRARGNRTLYRAIASSVKKGFKNRKEIIKVPSGPKTAVLDARFTGGLLLEQIERNMAQDSEVLRAIALANPTVIFSKSDIQDPM